MKSIVISIRPKWVAKILRGEKKLEIRTTRPKQDAVVYIYCTKSSYIGHVSNKHAGKVVAKFTFKSMFSFAMYPPIRGYDNGSLEVITKSSCLDVDAIETYAAGQGVCYAWEICDLEVFKEPKDISEFGLKRPPQSWQYLKEKAS